MKEPALQRCVLHEVQQAGVIGKAFEEFMSGHGIARSTGYRLIQEYVKPEKREQRQAVQRQKDEDAKAVRAAIRPIRWDSSRKQQVTPGGVLP